MYKKLCLLISCTHLVCPPVLYCMLSKKKTIIEKLFQEKNNIQELDRHWKDVDTKTIEKIVSGAMDINIRDKSGRPLLYHYIENIGSDLYHKKNVERLIKNGANCFFFYGNTNENLLHILYKQDYTVEKIHPGLKILLKQKGVSRTALNKGGKKPHGMRISLPPRCWLKAYFQDPEFIKFVLKNDTFYGIQATETGETLAITFLRNAGIFLGYKDMYDECEEKKLMLLKELITPDTVNLQDEYGNTLLHYLFLAKKWYSKPAKLSILGHALKNGADISIKNNKNQYPVIFEDLARYLCFCTSKHDCISNFKKYFLPCFSNEQEKIIFFNQALSNTSNIENSLVEKIIDISDVNYTDKEYGSLLLTIANQSFSTTQLKLLKSILTHNFATTKNDLTIFAKKYNNYQVIEYLLESGINIQNERPNNEVLFTDEKIMFIINTLKEYETSLNNRENLREWFVDAPKAILPLIFYRALALNHAGTLIIMADLYKKLYTPLIGLQHASEQNLSEVVPYFLKKIGLTPQQMIAYMMYKDSSLLTRLMGPKFTLEPKVYVLYKNAEKNGHKNFGKIFNYYYQAPHLLAHIRHEHKILGPDVSERIMNYLL